MRLAKAIENRLAVSIVQRGRLALCCWQVFVTTALSGCIVTREKPESWPDTAEQSAYPVGWDARTGQQSTSATGTAQDGPALLRVTAADSSSSPSREPRERLHCPDELLPRGDAQSEIAVELIDVRAEARELLPVDLRESLGNRERAARARYRAQLRVEDYAAPKLFRRLNAPRSEWAAGRLQAWLVISDAEKGTTLCRAPLQVKGDASNAKISRRLRESTRLELERRLYQRLNNAIDQTLSGISSVFRRKRPDVPA